MHATFMVSIYLSFLLDLAITENRFYAQNDKARVFQTLLLTAGINTLLQSVVGTCLPCVVGGSYAFLVPTLSIIYSDRLQAIQDDRLVCMT